MYVQDSDINESQNAKHKWNFVWDYGKYMYMYTYTGICVNMKWLFVTLPVATLVEC